MIKKGFDKTKDMIKEDIKKKKELQEKIQELSDDELKAMAIRKGSPYKEEWIQRQRNKKILNDEVKRLEKER